MPQLPPTATAKSHSFSLMMNFPRQRMAMNNGKTIPGAYMAYAPVRIAMISLFFKDIIVAKIPIRMIKKRMDLMLLLLNRSLLTVEAAVIRQVDAEERRADISDSAKRKPTGRGRVFRIRKTKGFNPFGSLMFSLVHKIMSIRTISKHSRIIAARKEAFLAVCVSFAAMLRERTSGPMK